MISFCRILRHMRVMFSTTTGVFILTDMRNRLRATRIKKTGWKVRLNVSHLSTNHNQITGLMVDM